MIYKQFKDKKLSSLGLGCMRFPTDESGAVDMQKTEEIIDLCMREGVNYYDTAYIYGGSEAAIGKIAGEQIIKLMTLGLTEAEAEAQIINGFLK